MINIWEYANTLPKATIVDNSMGEHSGQIIGVFDAEEVDEPEDCLLLETSDNIIQFKQSEILQIMVAINT